MILDWEGQNEKRKTYIGQLKHWGDKLQEINIKIDKNDKIVQDLIWHKLYHININSFKTNKLWIQSQINIYTDDSKTDLYAGSGYNIMRGNDTILDDPDECQMKP